MAPAFRLLEGNELYLHKFIKDSILVVCTTTFGEFQVKRGVSISNIVHKTGPSYKYKLKTFFTADSGDPLFMAIYFVVLPARPIEFNTQAFSS